MATMLTAEGAKQSLTAHVTAKGAEIFLKYGPRFGWAELQRLLEDRAYVRYPCSLQFGAAALQPGEFAHPEPRGESPEDGFVIHVHPAYLANLDEVPALVLYQLVVVNYGEFAAAAEAEFFGAAALGLTCDEYYEQLCALADRIAVAAEEIDDEPMACGASACGCGH